MPVDNTPDLRTSYTPLDKSPKGPNLTPPPLCLAAVARDSPQSAALWHGRYGHLSYGGMAQLVGEDQVIGIKVDKKAFLAQSKVPCEPCVMSKADKAPHPTSTSTHVKEPLELVHLDLSGKIRVPSLNGSLYFQAIQDDHSKYSGVTFHSTKSSVAKQTIDELTRWENLLGKRIKCIQIDNGTEYINHTFVTWCKDKGITIRKTVPDNPSSNGSAERLNRTLHERATALLYDSKFPAAFWAEMVNNANIIRNVSPTASHPTKTPFELFHGRKPRVHFLRIIGCTAYVHVPKDDRTHKMAPSAQIARLVGYSLVRSDACSE
jgi:hypothetical protein